MSSPGRWTLALGILITATALATSGCCSVRCCDKTAGLVLVSSSDSVSADPIVISKKRHQEILWKLPEGSTIQSIAINLEGKPVPFEGCATSEGTCRLACERHLCSSGAISAGLTPPHGGIYYSYAFQHAASTSSDPGIRIDP